MNGVTKRQRVKDVREAMRIVAQRIERNSAAGCLSTRDTRLLERLRARLDRQRDPLRRYGAVAVERAVQRINLDLRDGKASAYAKHLAALDDEGDVLNLSERDDRFAVQ